MFEAPPFLISSWSHVLSRTAAGNESLAFSIEGFFSFFPFFFFAFIACSFGAGQTGRGAGTPTCGWTMRPPKRAGMHALCPVSVFPKAGVARAGDAGGELQGSSGPGQADTACVFALGFICPLPKGREHQSSWREACPERRTKQEGSNSMRTHAYIKAHGGHCIHTQPKLIEHG
jgi:hypothetical protein